MNAVAREIAAAPGATATALTGRRLLYCVGAQRAGTSWLDAMFRAHPEMHVPVLKEVHYWDELRLPGTGWRRRQAGSDLDWHRQASFVARARRYPLRTALKGGAVERLLAARVRLYDGAGHAGYAALMTDGSRPGQVLVDNTPAYALLDAATFAEMAAMADARFLFVMRDPVERLWSGIRHRLERGLADGSVTAEAAVARFAAALEAEGDRDLARSDYARTLAALEAAVEPSRLLCLFHETMFEAGTAERVAAFVGVAPRRARPRRRVNRGRALDAAPDAALRARARERLAPVYADVRRRFGGAVPGTWMA